ncbi:MAG: DUF2341 domain-containing protein, partial [Fibrobacteria bacterium]|nr:DUF2341 domain-containing protein [Fibrobacteria bacterium]
MKIFKTPSIPVWGRCTCTLLCLFVFLQISVATDYSSWTYSRKYNINTTSSGANVSSTESNFPVLIRLDEGLELNNFTFSQALAGGADVRFTASDGTTDLSYDIENWKGQNVGNRAFIWVRIPTITGNSKDQYFIMHWGKAGQTTTANNEAVFSNGYYFQGVWHLDEDGNNNADGYKDATNNNDHGRGYNLIAGASDGYSIIGNGCMFNGVNQYIDMGTNPNPLGWEWAVTVSMWIWRYDVSSEYEAIFQRDGATSGQAPLIYSYNGTNYIYTDLDNDAGAGDGTGTTYDATLNGAWRYLTFVFDGQDGYTYLDGVLKYFDDGDATTNYYWWDDQVAVLGKYSTLGYFSGWVDELRVSNVARSAGWARMSFQNQQRYNGTLLDIDNDAPSNPSSCNDANGSTDNTWGSVADANFTWSGAGDGSGVGVKDYYYYWGTSSSGSPSNNVSSAAYNPGAIASGSTYYLRVTTRDYNGNISAATTIYTLKYDDPPSAPGTPSDAGEYIGATAATFTWTAATDAESGVDSYWLQVGTSAGASDVYDADVGDVLTKEVTGLSSGNTYYARVKAQNGNGSWGDYSGNSDGITIGYSSWTYSTNMYINTTATGADVSGDVTNFPLLVRLNAANFDFSQADNEGDDLRFTLSDGLTDLPYEIERYDNAVDSAEIWVLIPTVTGNNKTQYFIMHWGKGSQSTTENSEAVFTTANNFQGVWHIDEEAAGTTTDNNYLDASQNNYHLDDRISSTDRSGVVGRGHYFDGSDYLVEGDILDFERTDSYTISAWAKHASAQNGTVIGKMNNADPYTGWDMYWQSTHKIYSHLINTNTSNAIQEYTNGTFTTDAWYLITISYDGSSNASGMNIYVNGILQSTTVSQNTLSASTVNANVFAIGTRSTSGYFDGYIDEVRVANTVRSANWVKLEYATQRPDQQTVTFETETYAGNWDDSCKVFLNTAYNGADVSENQLNFPVLIRLNKSNFDFADVYANGTSMRFSKSDGTHLYYEIQRWDDTNEEAEIWVKPDTVYGNNSSQYIVMWWDADDKGSRSNSKMVFNRANGFAGVWHLDENGNSTADG